MGADLATDRIKSWLVDAALPLWSTAGVDDATGAFHERLTFDGAPVPGGTRRFRVQCRQIYSFSHAALLGWNPDVLEVARRAVVAMADTYWHADGGWMFTATPDGAVADPTRNSYEQAFGLLALSWYYRASKDDLALGLIDQTLQFVDSLADPVNGGYLETPDGPLPRRQNPHMHLLEASMALYETFGDQGHLDRASTIVDLARRAFIDPDCHELGEYFTQDWQWAPGDAGAVLEPGHHFEWAWLLDRYATLSGDTSVCSLAGQIHRCALAGPGLDTDTTIACDETNRAGAIIKPTKRLWVQTEHLKANLVGHRFDPPMDTDAAAHRIVDAMFEHYLKPNGVWQDQLDADNNGTQTDVTAATLYHLFVAFDDYLKRFDSPTYTLA